MAAKGLLSWKLGSLPVIEMTGEGREITAGQITIRTIVRVRVVIGPGEKLVSLHIEPLVLIVTRPDEKYALCMDGQPADMQSILDSIS
ncbi:MAG: hypothetical protein LUP00_00675 [Methanothrix sp.]|nr:hypothetical protein [Methanothrix sp.]